MNTAHNTLRNCSRRFDRLTLAAFLFAAFPCALVADEPSSVVETKADDAASDAKAKVETVKQLEQIGTAMRAYYASFNRYPDPAILDNNANPLLSWRVALLPFLKDLKARELHEKFHLNEPWDSEHNKSLIAEMPDVFKCPKSGVAEKGMTV